MLFRGHGRSRDRRRQSRSSAPLQRNAVRCRNRAGKTSNRGRLKMRKIRIIEQISLDGVIQAPGGRDEGGDDYAHGGWTAPYRNTAMGEAVAEAQRKTFDLLLGRRTPPLRASGRPCGVYRNERRTEE